MIPGWITSLRRFGVCGLLLAASPVLADEPAAGVVRISKPATVTVRAQSEPLPTQVIVPAGGHDHGQVIYSDCPNGDCYGDGSAYGRGGKYGYRGYDNGYSMMQ